MDILHLLNTPTRRLPSEIPETPAHLVQEPDMHSPVHSILYTPEASIVS
jgi:hypothetical protein